MPKHALLSASSAKRWTECPPSAKLNAEALDQTSIYAEEGTDAHTLCQYLVEKEYGLPTKDPRENLTYYNKEMEECASIYLQTVNELMAEARKECFQPAILVEHRVNFSKWVPEGFGTADCVILSDKTAYVIDYKHGAGVLVSAKENVQLMCYALGILDILRSLYDTERISLTIVQPRKDNISTWSISIEELLTWADSFLAPRAAEAFRGKGEFKAGEHCQFCKIKATCRKRAETNLELAKLDFELPATLDDSEITDVLSKVDNLVTWANDVKEYALKEALSGKKYEGFKLVEGRSTRKFTNENAVAKAVTEAGFNPYEQKLLGITAMTSLLGKKNFEDLLGQYTCKPQGKPTLVPVTDKRPEYNSAVNDFNDNMEEKI